MPTLRLLLTATMCLVLLTACGPKGVKPMSPEDTPQNHYLRGMQLVERGEASQAQARFARALELEPHYAPAIAGQALVAAMGVPGQPSAELSNVQTERFRDLAEEGWSDARSSADKFVVAVTAIRAETTAKADGWIKRAARWHAKGRVIRDIAPVDLPYYRNMQALNYFMGRAWFIAGDYEQAKPLLKLVMGTQAGRWHQPANDVFGRIQSIERATANYTIGNVSRTIATKDAVSRADVAALLVIELRLNKLFSDPAAGTAPEAAFVPADIAEHRFKEEIVTILKWNVRGLEPEYDRSSQAKLFLPEEPVTRGQMALALEDILIKATGDETLAVRYLGQEQSPFIDVKPNTSFYNAAMNSISRSLMETDLSGAFRPEDEMSGAELLLAVVRLRNAVNN